MRMAISKVDFSLLVERMRSEKNTTYIESCIEVAESIEIEQEQIPNLLTRSLRDKIEIEAIDAKTVKIPRPVTLDWMDDL